MADEDHIISKIISKAYMTSVASENTHLRHYSLLSAYGIQLNPTCRESIILSLENDGGFLYPLIDK